MVDQQQQHELNEIERWASLLREATLERNVAIRKASRDGLTTRQIAEVAELSHSSVAKLLAEPKELPQGWLRPMITGEERSRQASEPPRGAEQPLGKRGKGRFAGKPGSEA